MAPAGKLVVVGTGIAPGHLTAEARTWIERADKVLYLIASPVPERLVKRLKPDAESLMPYYAEDKPRVETYEQMVARILECVRGGGTVCTAFYGHPGIFVYPSHEAIRRARREGYEAMMVPGISSLDCLFADLGVDPARGCQMYEATDLLLARRPLDPASVVIVWQVGVVGQFGYRASGDFRNLPVLVEYLERVYGPDHRVVVYEAADDPRSQPLIRRYRLADLGSADVSPASTLYVPPARRPDVDRAMAERLGISPEALAAVMDPPPGEPARQGGASRTAPA